MFYLLGHLSEFHVVAVVVCFSPISHSPRFSHIYLLIYFFSNAACFFFTAHVLSPWPLQQICSTRIKKNICAVITTNLLTVCGLHLPRLNNCACHSQLRGQRCFSSGKRREECRIHCNYSCFFYSNLHVVLKSR